MSQFESKHENQRVSEQEKTNLIEVIEKIKQSGLFDSKYLEDLKFILFSERRNMLFENQSLKNISKEDYSESDFMQGTRTDYVGIQPKDEFLEYDTNKLDDKHFLPFLFLKEKLTYEEFVVHEIAHSLFDVQYKREEGEYEDKDGISDVNDQYRERIIGIVRDSCEKYYPQLEIDRFTFTRQQIAEIFAMLYQREFCNRLEINSEMHNNVIKNVDEFMANPNETLEKFNQQNKRNCSLEDIYKENHILSIIIAPLLEKEISDFDERVSLFWKNPDSSLN